MSKRYDSPGLPSTPGRRPPYPHSNQGPPTPHGYQGPPPPHSYQGPFNQESRHISQQARPPSNNPPPYHEQDAPLQAQQSRYGQDPPIGRSRRDREKRPPPSLQLKPIKSPGGPTFVYGNLAAVCPADFPDVAADDFYIRLNEKYIFSARITNACQPGEVGLTDPQRTLSGVGVGPRDIVQVELHDPFASGEDIVLDTMSLEINFAGKKMSTEQFDPDQLSDDFAMTYKEQMFVVGQHVIMNFKNITFRMTVVDAARVAAQGKEDNDKKAREGPKPGIVTEKTNISLMKDPMSSLNLKASKKRVVTTSIMQQGFKFEDLGIGGLDKQFAIIFRRAFASRMFPAALAEKMNLTHVRGILLYGPPGTGKTLIARKIGATLNAVEPKVVNGPEILNKYVGQSEENIRNLFADAEKDQKEKGNGSGLHVIIFDEIDAICKQRGSGGGGGTGVGDSIVNQLLSKLDGVNQLNNILVIGMTNRLDMIDDALLRPGRLELHIEVHLPDEDGREQILGIHTKIMKEGGFLEEDVNLRKIAKLTVNFSGAELSGLVRAAQSFAMQRHYEIGESIKLKEDYDQIKVKMTDMVAAVDEITPAYGAKMDQLTRYIQGDILPFSDNIQMIREEAKRQIDDVRGAHTAALKSIILHGPPRSGKTALAARIAIDSGFPFIRIISRRDMMSLPESVRVSRITDIFQEAYKSSLSMIVIDSLELLVDYVSLGPRFNTPNLTALLGSIKEPPPDNHRLVVIATSSQWSGIGDLGFKDAFQFDIEVPAVESMDELRSLVALAGILPNDVASAALQMAGNYIGNEVDVGVARILEGMRVALRAKKPAEYFVEDLKKAMRLRPRPAAPRREQ